MMRSGFLSVALLLGFTSANAAAVFSTSIDLPGASLDDSDQSGAISELANEGIFFGGAQASAAAASVFAIGARASFEIPANDPVVGGILSSGAGAMAGVRFDDIVFTHINNAQNNTPIEVSTNFFLDGFFSLMDGSGDTRVSAGISVNYGLGTGPANAVTTIGGISRTRDRGNLSANNSGVFANAGLSDAMFINDTFTSAALTVPVGLPLPLTLRIIVGTQGASRDGGTIAGTSDFHDTLFFVANGPVFNLPDGYTANSLTARIVDNHLQAVPVPAAMVVFSGGIVALGLTRRASRRD